MSGATLLRTPETPSDLDFARERGAKLYSEFEAQMSKHCARGLVDCKMKLFVGPETTTAGVIKTLTNVLRLLDANKARPLSLS